MKPHIVERYKRRMSYFGNCDCMANSSLMSRRNFEATTKIFPLSGSNSTQQLDTVTFTWAKYTQRYFRPLLVRNLIEEA